MASSTASRTTLEDTIKKQIVGMMADTPTRPMPAFTPPTKEEPKEVHVHLPEGCKWASDVIGSSVTPDFPVRVFEDSSWDERIRCFIPNPKRGYMIQIEQATDILRAWEIGDKVLISGPTGAGKSSLVEHLCSLVRRPFIRVNATADMDSSMLFGQLTAKDGSTIWVDGTVTEAVRYGAVFVWDEWDVTPAEIGMGMQWLLEEDGKLFLKEMPGTAKDKFIVPHEHFCIMCLGNTLGQGDETGQHAGTNVQNTASIDRFGTAIKLGYLPPISERMMLTSVVTGYDDKAADNLIKFAGLVRKGYQTGTLSLTMSPRALIAVAKKVKVWGMTTRTAVEKVYLNKLSDGQRIVAQQLFDKVYGS